MPKVVNLWPDKKLTCPGCTMRISIKAVPYQENRCPQCGELLTVVSKNDDLFRECQEEDDP